MQPINPFRRPARRPGLKELLADDRGATAIEYGLIAALMAVVIIGALQTLGGETGSLYTVLEEIGAAIATAIGG